MTDSRRIKVIPTILNPSKVPSLPERGFLLVMVLPIQTRPWKREQAAVVNHLLAYHPVKLLKVFLLRLLFTFNEPDYFEKADGVFVVFASLYISLFFL